MLREKVSTFGSEFSSGDNLWVGIFLRPRTEDDVRRVVRSNCNAQTPALNSPCIFNDLTIGLVGLLFSHVDHPVLSLCRYLRLVLVSLFSWLCFPWRHRSVLISLKVRGSWSRPSVNGRCNNPSRFECVLTPHSRSLARYVRPVVKH